MATANYRKLTARELSRPSISEYAELPKLPVTIVLDNLRSGLNVGSIFRSADSFRAGKILCCGITPIPPHREVLKTALGATDSVSWEYRSNTVAALAELNAEGWHLVAIEQTTGAQALTSFTPEAGQKYALVFGHEVQGIAQHAIDLCQTALQVEQWGTKHSLNVAVCAGIVLYHCAGHLLSGFTEAGNSK